MEAYYNEGLYYAYKKYVSLSKTSARPKSIKDRIRIKVKMVDNYGMEAFNRKPGGGGRPAKRDDSDIPSIIDELNEEQKR